MGLYTVIDHRAFRALHTIATGFQPFAAIQSMISNQVELNGAKLGVEQLRASYKIINKWMGRVYIYTWSWSLHDDSPQEDIVIKCKYSGKMGGKRTVRFVSKQQTPLLDALNQDKQIMQLCHSVDYESIELRYSRPDQCWHIEMRPNYGDYIWILLPPVRYVRKPKQEEMEDTMQLIKKLARRIKS